MVQTILLFPNLKEEMLLIGPGFNDSLNVFSICDLAHPGEAMFAKCKEVTVDAG